MSVQGNRAGRVVGILVSAIFAFFAFAGVANAAGEYEPNETRGTPAGPIAPGSTIMATFENTHDTDWYKYYVAEETEVRFTVTKTNAPDIEMGAEMVYENGDNVKFKKLPIGTGSAELVATVPPGKYFAWIYGGVESDNTGQTYSIAFTRGLSTFQAIQNGCAVSQGQVDSLTGQRAATAALVAKQTKAVGKANKSLSKARKKKATTRAAKAKKKKAIAKARKGVKNAKKLLAGARADQAKAEADYAKAKANSDKLCGVPE